MNLFQLILKNMRQRALSTFLTMLSVMLGVGLANAVIIAQRQSEKVIGQSDFGYDVLIGPKGSKLNLVLNSAYGMGAAQGTVPWSVYTDLLATKQSSVRWAVPFMVGDSYSGFHIMATTPLMFGMDDDLKLVEPSRAFAFRKDQSFQFATGRSFVADKFEGVIGYEVAQKLKLGVGATFKMEHGGDATDVHNETWTIVGVLQQTYTAMDRTIFIPLVSAWAVPEHHDALEQMAKLGMTPEQIKQATQAAAAPADKADDHGHDHDSTGKDDQDDHDHAATTTAPADDHDDHDHDHAYHMHDDHIHLHLEESKKKVSGIFLRSRGGGISALTLMYGFNANPLAAAMAVSPASEMREFFNTFLTGSTWILLALAVLVSIVAALSILVSIYNSVAARRREIAILRALGATKQRILTLLCCEAVMIGLLGGIAGIVLGHLLAAIGSAKLQATTGQAIDALSLHWHEWAYLAGVVVLALLAGLVPALKAYQTSVAENLAAE